MLKRKNEDSDSVSDDISKKRVALDGDQLDESIKHEQDSITAPAITSPEDDEYEPEIIQSHPEPDTEPEPEAPAPEVANVSGDEDAKSDDAENESNSYTPEAPVAEPVKEAENDESDDDIPRYDEAREKSPPSSGEQLPGYEVDDKRESPSLDNERMSSGRREREDPTTVLFRMYCPVKEAGIVVGKKGETINHIRDKANVKIYVSENIKTVPERIVTVRGAAENVAKAFGLIVRTILDEPEDEPSSSSSRPFDLRLLMPHPIVGFIIGRHGSKFREIEENSAAKLKAAETPLPYSTDRILLINGVSDAIHIAVYYVAQAVLEHKDVLQLNKIILYNPANYQANLPSTTLAGMSPQPNNNMNMNTMNNMNMGGMANQNQMGGNMNALNALNSLSNLMMPNNNMVPNNNNMMMNPMNSPMGTNMNTNMGPNMSSPMNNMNSMNGMNNMNNMNNMNGMSGMNNGMMQNQPPYGGQNNYQMMPQQNYNLRQPMNIPQQQTYTDENGNTMVGEIITNPPVPNPTGQGDKYNQDLYVANASIGSVIGKGGNNIKQIRETSGCTYVKIEPDKHRSMMLSGRGMVNMRKLTLTGSLSSINTAIYLINQRISTDKERNFN